MKFDPMKYFITFETHEGLIIDIEKTDRECCGNCINCIHVLKDDITNPCSVCEVVERDLYKSKKFNVLKLKHFELNEQNIIDYVEIVG